jgi:hypothetical protein
MTENIVYYKIRTIKKLLNTIAQKRDRLLDELIINATDPVIVNRRIRMIQQLGQYEAQLLSKIQSFETDDVSDFADELDLLTQEIVSVIRRDS